MNQRLLLQHFAPVVEDLTLLFTVADASAAVPKFLRVIRAGNDAVEPGKLVLMNQLAVIWRLSTNGTTAPLLEHYMGEIRQALHRLHGHTEPEVSHILNSLFLTNSAALVAWIAMLASVARDGPVTHWLLEIALNFPKPFPWRVMVRLVVSSLQSTHEVLLAVAYWLNSRATLCKTPQEKLHHLPKHIIPLGKSLSTTNREDLDNVIDELSDNLRNGFNILSNLWQTLHADMQRGYL
jgi:hypothetical protein